MRLTCAVLAALCLAFPGCNGDQGQHANREAGGAVTETASGTSTGAATPGGTEGDAAEASAPAVDQGSVAISFKGIVVHVLEPGGVQRAVIPRVSGHDATILLPAAMENAIRNKNLTILGTCGATCEVDIDGFALRVYNPAVPAPGPFVPSSDFTTLVPSLSKVQFNGKPTDRPFRAKANWVRDVFSDPRAGSVVRGYVELNGATGTSTRFGCTARWDYESSLYPWSKVVTATYPVSAGTKLQVRRAGPSNWEDLGDLAGGQTLRVDNDTVGTSDHVQNLKKLLVKPRDLPRIVTQGDCGAAGVPGCSNSTWP